MEAGDAGADYVAFGSFYPTTTKDVRHRADPALLSWWATMFELPCVAIGGITPANARPLIEAGADFLAVPGAVWNGDEAEEIGRASWRERVCQYGWIEVVAVSLKKK